MRMPKHHPGKLPTKSLRLCKKTRQTLGCILHNMNSWVDDIPIWECMQQHSTWSIEQMQAHTCLPCLMIYSYGNACSSTAPKAVNKCKRTHTYLGCLFGDCPNSLDLVQRHVVRANADLGCAEHVVAVLQLCSLTRADAVGLAQHLHLHHLCIIRCMCM